MQKSPIKIAYLIFLVTFISGAAGLIYQIVWSRMLVLVFGSGTHSIVAVISAFLGGLALGSLLIGNWCDKKRPDQLVKVYFYLEIGIAFFAGMTLLLIPGISRVYALFSDGSTLSPELLLIKFLLTTVILLPPTILMGGTLPLLVSLLRHYFEDAGGNLSLLYCLNTFGAVLGVIIAAFISIELLGLKGTVVVGMVLNLLAGTSILKIPQYITSKNKEDSIPHKFNPLSVKEKVILVCFFISGLVSVSYEILWTRLLTPTTGTFTYAFASILAIYLIGIALGSLLFNKFRKLFSGSKLLFALSEVGIGFFALCSVLIISSDFSHSLILPLVVILPASIWMGVAFPAAIDLLKREFYQGKQVGIAYFTNTVGSIIGGIVASFILIPFIGSSPSVLLLCIINFLLAAVLIFAEIKSNPNSSNLFLNLIAGLLLLISVWMFVFNKDQLLDFSTKQWIAIAHRNGAQIINKEDEIASVIGIKGRADFQSNLLIDGVGITGKTIETPLMAHIPIAIHPNPKSILAICFGMGSTFRSALLHKIDTDAVELSPSVASMFSLFYPRGKDLMASASANIIINDGRNYVNLTHKKYDIITIDPPPPFNAAGTTVLYSEDFYKSMNRILNPGAVVMQWVPADGRRDDQLMVKKSFINVFPYIIALKSPNSPDGNYLVGSYTPIIINKDRFEKVFSSPVVKNDLGRFGNKSDAETILGLMTDKDALIEQTKEAAPVTDDHPRTEYFLLRHLFSKVE